MPWSLSNVWNSDGDKEYPGEAFVMALVYVGTCVTLIYVLSIYEASEFQSSLPRRARLLGSGLRVCKHVQMAPVVGQSFTGKMTVGSSASCTSLWAFIRDILVKG